MTCAGDNDSAQRTDRQPFVPPWIVNPPGDERKGMGAVGHGVGKIKWLTPAVGPGSVRPSGRQTSAGSHQGDQKGRPGGGSKFSMS